MGATQPNTSMCMNFEDMQQIMASHQYIIINTLPSNMQQCLIQNTLSAFEEEDKINGLLNSKHTHLPIVVYGKNNTDDSVWTKAHALKRLGFSQVFVYVGGMFEWMLLQEIYGNGFFPTTEQELDILKFKAPSKMT